MTFFEYFPDAGFGLILIAFLPVAFISCVIFDKAQDKLNQLKPRIAVFLAKIIYHEDWSYKLRQK